MALLLAAESAVSTTYKWTDAGGRVVYSDQPPAGNIKSEIVLSPPPPANPGAVKELNKQEGELKKRQTDAAEDAKKSDAQRAEMAKRSETCMKAQGQVRALAAEQVQLIRQNAKGEDVYVDDATRRKERAEIEAWIKGNCQAG